LKNPQTGCTIDGIIASGPEAYQNGKGDKNCSRYIEALFDKIIKEFNKLISPRRTEMIDGFKSLFRSMLYNVLECSKCKVQHDNY